MADRIDAKNSDAKFIPHPTGQFVAQCVDVIDLGQKVEEYAGQPTKLSHKCALVFRTGEVNPETGDLIDISQEYTVSMSEKANLRKVLESWRGRGYAEDELDAGVPLDKLEGQYALVGVDNKTSAQGRKYARIVSVVSVPKQMKNDLPGFAKYERPKFWEERRAAYQKATTKFLDDIGAPTNNSGRITGPAGDPGPQFSDEPYDDDDSSIPF